MIKLKWKDNWITFGNIQWSGSAEQSSRELSFTIPINPYKKDLKGYQIKLGDIVSMYDDNTLLFLGVVTNREKAAEIGEGSYTAKDFCHYLLRSNGTYMFKNYSPEKIVKKVCKDVKIPVGTLAKTGIRLPKLYFDDACLYDIIIKAYRKAKATTGKKYMITMQGKKVSVIEKGKDSGVELVQGKTITGATYSDTTDDMVNLVKIYNDKKKHLGTVKNVKNVDAYGVYAQSYTKESGVNAKSQAKAMFVGITQEASVEAIGDIRAISGKSISIKDDATGLSGKFYITNDTHTFESGTHTMSLELSWNNVMEEGAESTGDSSKKDLSNNAKCYYIDSSKVYHSMKSCSACKGKNTKSSTVGKIKKIKIATGKNKGKRKYKPCSKCWNT